MSKILISYRREDSADVTGRIYDRLIQQFGREAVFKDVDSIPLGADFRIHLDAQVAKCDVFLAVIGRDWMKKRGSKSKSRLDEPEDFVRIEIESALRREIPVIPVLVSGVSIPSAERLPASIQDLSYRNGIAVRPDPDFHRDMDRLIESLKKEIKGLNEHRTELGTAVREPERTADEMVHGETMFFISYSRTTDLPRAQALYQSLLRLGVRESEVWFDRSALSPGQGFQRHILDVIRGCRYFLPLLSRASTKRDEDFVFNEWREATQRLNRMNRDFLIPVIVDADFMPECYSANPVREWADKHLHFAHAPEGRPDDRLEKKLRALVRDARLGSEQS